MHLPVIQLINFSIILIVLVFLIKYLWDIFFDDTYEPIAWEEARKNGCISKELLKYSRNFGDRIRFYTIWLQIQRIKDEGVEGDFAELGVYKGASARLIHLAAPHRVLHLFDTFEGFTDSDIKIEVGEAATYDSSRFSDTTVGKVLKFINGSEEYIKVHPGYFPDSTLGLEETQFAFVSMDADLYNPTKAGLEFFYPRLEKGGVIMIHDYNYKWEGLMKAVNEFVTTIPESLIYVADIDSTVMIVKNR